MERKDIVIGCMGILLISSIAAGVYVHHSDGARIRQLERMIGQLQAKERRSAMDRTVSKQLEEIANGQQALSEERSLEAIRQSEIAQAATLRSEAERHNALRAQAAAEQSAQEAISSYQMAERQRKEANEQRQVAVHAKQVADTLNYISLGRTLGSQSFSIYRTGDTEIGNMLAYASYMFTRDYGGDFYAPAVFQALIQSAGGRKNWSIHNGSVSDLDFFPGSNRMLTVSTYGEIMQHEMRDGHLTTKPLFSNKNYCFRDVMASKLGEGYALSHTGHLMIVTPKKTEIIRLENLTKPFRMEYMPDALDRKDAYYQEGTQERHLLVIGERNLALVDLTTHEVTATRQLDFNIISASRHENKPLLFDDKGHMHLVNSIDDIRDEKVPVRGTISAYTHNKKEGLTAYGTMEGTIYIIDKNRKTHRLVGHLSQVTRLKIIGRGLYSSSYDGKLLFWMTGENQVKPITLLQAGSWITGFTQDAGKDYIWTGESNGTISQFLISLPLIAQRLKQNVKRNFTRDEWDYYVGKGIPYRKVKSEE